MAYLGPFVANGWRSRRESVSESPSMTKAIPKSGGLPSPSTTGLSDGEITEIEGIALDRRSFFGQRSDD
jgi:hypothetical protein